MKYAVLDIETTGLSPKNEKITEIAIYIHDGEKIVEEYSTLINPEKKIPYRIVQMTGINNSMVVDAPKFYEVAKRIVEITEKTTIVGHNVRFDYGFIRQEFLSLGYDFQRKTLDTAKLSRQLIPGQSSYSLGKLCKSLNIDNQARHRAQGDALATVTLFELLRSIDGNSNTVNNSKIEREERTHSFLKELPHAPGVYYFYNAYGDLVYVGKSIDIQSRVQQHLNNNSTKKAVEMKNNLADVHFTLTGNELVALLLESAEIKKYRPLYNRAQLRSYFNYGLYSFTDENGYINLKINKIIENSQPLYTYASAQEGKEHLYNLMEQFTLCQKLSGLYETSGACFHYQIHQCNGACVGEERAEVYNLRVEEALRNYYFEKQNFIIIDKGRNCDEKTMVKVTDGKYDGFGFVSVEALQSPDFDADDAIQPQQDNKEVRRIIINYLKQKKAEQVIPILSQ